MNRILDRFAVRVAHLFGLDPCVMVCRVRWLLCWRPEVRSVWCEILNRVQAGQVPARGDLGAGRRHLSAAKMSSVPRLGRQGGGR